MPKGVYLRTDYHKKITSKALKGKHNSPQTEIKKGQHLSPKTEFKKGSNGFKGKHTEETKKKMGEKAKKRVGIKASNWKGGISKELYGSDFTEKLKEKIRKRDNYICQLCNRTQNKELKKFGYRLPIHHIDYDKKNNKENNLITLCKGCNSTVNKDRLDWMRFFQPKVANKK